MKTLKDVFMVIVKVLAFHAVLHCAAGLAEHIALDTVISVLKSVLGLSTVAVGGLIGWLQAETK